MKWDVGEESPGSEFPSKGRVGGGKEEVDFSWKSNNPYSDGSGIKFLKAKIWLKSCTVPPAADVFSTWESRFL